MMGCLKSKEEHVHVEEQQTFSWDREDRPDPKDYTIADRNDATCGRKPCTVNGQQFIIDRCTNSYIYIFDHSAMVTIDNCENCKIFLGPVKGSVFIRNSKNCQLVVACQQFRSRDCRKIDTYLCCATQPIIESSAGMRFGCFQCYYPELEGQFQKAGLSVYNNSWSVIHDFTPLQEGNNWSMLADSTSVEEAVPKPSTEDFADIDISYDMEKSVVPLTRGKRSKRHDDSCLVTFFHNNKPSCNAYLNKLIVSTEYDIVQTKEISMTVEDAVRIFKDDKYCELADKGPLVGLELNGKDIIHQSEEVLKELGISLNSVFLSKDQKHAKSDIDSFYNFVDMTMST